jgi:hypothetical protein
LSGGGTGPDERREEEAAARARILQRRTGMLSGEVMLTSLVQRKCPSRDSHE